MLTRIVLTYLPVGWLVTRVSAPWWVIVLVALVAWASTDLTTSSNSQGFRCQSWLAGCVLFLVLPLIFLLSFLMVLVSLRWMAWSSQGEEFVHLHGVTLATGIFLIFLPLGLIHRYQYTDLGARLWSWYWVLLLGGTGAIALHLAYLLTTPALTSLPMDGTFLNKAPFLSAFKLPGWRLLEIVDSVVALSLAWMLSVIQTIPEAKFQFLKSWSAQVTSRIVLGGAVLGMVIGAALSRL